MDLQQLETELLKLLGLLSADVLKLQTGDMQIVKKADESPLTAADRLVSSRLQEFFAAKCPGLGIVDEESSLNPNSIEEALLIDPLDGTKEFIAGKPDFTINVALVRRGKPIWGVVVAPAHGEIFLGDQKRGYRVITNHQPVPQNNKSLRVVMSGSHAGEPERNFVALLQKSGRSVKTLSYGSSLKICRLAKEEADLYPRFGPTMEWDTAAAHAVLLAAGGSLLALQTGEELQYGKPEYRNSPFLAFAGSMQNSERKELLNLARLASQGLSEVANA